MQADIRTTLTPAEAIHVIGAAHERIFLVPPSGVLWLTLAAWSAFETDAWRAMHGFNFVNLRGSWRGRSTSFKASEIIDGREVFLPPSADNLFRSYPTALDGAEDALRFIGTASAPPRPNRYQAAWEAAQRGDVPAFVDGLRNPTINGMHVPGFFTANPTVYLAGVQRHALKLRALIPTPEGFPLV